jgi:ankyrin repeat protein
MKNNPIIKINGSGKNVLSISEYKKFENMKKENPELYQKNIKKEKIIINSYEDLDSYIMFGEVEKLEKEFNGNYNEIEEHYSIDFLHRAAEYNSTISMKYLVEVVGLDINKKDEKGFTPLQVAINEGNVEIVKYLLEKNVNIEEPDPDFYFNAFYLALQNGYETTENSKDLCYEIALLLFKKGTKILEEYQGGNEDFRDIELIYNLKKEGSKKARELLAELKKEYPDWLK